MLFKKKGDIEIIVFNKSGSIVTSYTRLKEFLKDIFNRDFSLDWSDKFVVHFSKKILQEFSSSKNKKVVTTRCGDFRKGGQFDLNEESSLGVDFAENLGLGCSATLEYKKSRILHVAVFRINIE